MNEFDRIVLEKLAKELCWRKGFPLPSEAGRAVELARLEILEKIKEMRNSYSFDGNPSTTVIILAIKSELDKLSCFLEKKEEGEK